MVINPLYDEVNGALYDTILELHNVQKTTELANSFTVDSNLDRSEFRNVYRSITYNYIIIIIPHYNISVVIRDNFIFQYSYCSSLGPQKCSSSLATTADLSRIDNEITFSTRFRDSDCDIMEEENIGTYEVPVRNNEGEDSYIQMNSREI